jgi:hypothetical protein
MGQHEELVDITRSIVTNWASVTPSRTAVMADTYGAFTYSMCKSASWCFHFFFTRVYFLSVGTPEESKYFCLKEQGNSQITREIHAKVA